MLNYFISWVYKFSCLAVIFIYCLNVVHAQTNYTDTIFPKDTIAAAPQEIIKSFIAKKKYNSSADFVYAYCYKDTTGIADGEKVNVYYTKSITLFEPIMDSTQIIYHVIRVLDLYKYEEKEHPFTSTCRIILTDSNLAPLFISNALSISESNSFVFNSVVNNNLLSFYTIIDTSREYFYILSPKTFTNDFNELGYQLKYKGKRVCFFEVPIEQRNTNLVDLILEPSSCRFYCTCAYGSND